jgi:hypothetical protein
MVVARDAEHNVLLLVARNRRKDVLLSQLKPAFGAAFGNIVFLLKRKPLQAKPSMANSALPRTLS